MNLIELPSSIFGKTIILFAILISLSFNLIIISFKSISEFNSIIALLLVPLDITVILNSRKLSSKSDSILDDVNSQDSSKNEKVSEEDSVISDISCETSSSEESSKVSEKELNEIIKQGWVDWLWGIDPNLSNKKRKLK